MEKEIKIAAQLYKCRDTAKKFFGAEFKKKLEPYTHVLNEVMKSNKLDEFGALFKISKTEHYQDSGMVQLLYMASVVEMLEPSS